MSTRKTLGLVAGLLLVPAGASTAHDPLSMPAEVEAGTSFADELAQIDRKIAEADSQGSPAKRVFWRYTRAALTGDPKDWESAWNLIQGAIEEGRAAAPELLLYQATVALELHRPDEAEGALDRLAETDPFLASGSYPKLLRGDVAQQRKQRKEALRIYEEVLASEKTWEVLARAAFCERMADRYRKADRLYAEAQEPLTVKEMRRWAWLEVQRGLVDLDRGRDGDAQEHFRRADRAYPGYWFVERQLSSTHRSREALP